MSALCSSASKTCTDLISSCEELAQVAPGSINAHYSLYLGGDPAKPYTAYCKDMATAPKSYLTLVANSNTNFSQYTAGGSVPGTNVRTTYTKVRFDPVKLTIDPNDQTFSKSTGRLTHGTTQVTAMPYGVAEDCMALNSASGISKLDLTNLPFIFAPSQFSTGGNSTGGGTVIASDKKVDMTGGGLCGWTAVKGSDNPFNQNGLPIQLQYKQ